MAYRFPDLYTGQTPEDDLLDNGATPAYGAPQDAPPTYAFPDLEAPAPLHPLDRIALALQSLQPQPVSRPFESGGSAFARNLVGGLASGFSSSRGADLQRQEQARTLENQQRMATSQKVYDAALKSWELRQSLKNAETLKASPGPIKTPQQMQDDAFNTEAGKLKAQGTKPAPTKKDLQQIYQEAFTKSQATMAGQLASLTPGGRKLLGGMAAAQGDLSGLGFGAPMRIAALNEVASGDATPGNTAPSGQEMVARGASFRSDKASLGALQKNRDQVKVMVDQLDKNINLTLDRLNKIPDTGSPVANDLQRAVSVKVLGRSDVAQFNAALQTVQFEASRILNSGMTATGVLTESARKDLQAVTSKNFTRRQLRDVANVLKIEAANRMGSLDAGLESIRGRLKGTMQPNAPGVTHIYDPASGRAVPVGGGR